MQLLVQHGADIKHRSRALKGTPLQLAASKGHYECVQWLVQQQGATPAEVTDALEYAGASGNLDTLHFLLESGADVAAVGCRALRAALAGPHAAAAVALLKAGVVTNRRVSPESAVSFFVDGLRPLVAQCIQSWAPAESAALYQAALDHGQTDLAEVLGQAGALLKDVLETSSGPQ
jgi:ankyrin repeat protein